LLGKEKGCTFRIDFPFPDEGRKRGRANFKCGEKEEEQRKRASKRKKKVGRLVPGATRKLLGDRVSLYYTCREDSGEMSMIGKKEERRRPSGGQRGRFKKKKELLEHRASPTRRGEKDFAERRAKRGSL